MLYQDLQRRGLIYQQTTEDMENILKTPQTFYCGFDPTSSSLHIGSLLPLLTARRLQQAGHTPMMLIGGATGMIGDPSGKSKERNLLTPEVIAQNVHGIQQVMEKFLDFEGDNAAVIVNNMDWMEPFSYIQFLRDVGKHFTLNYMMAKDSVKGRLQDKERGISYTEFSYMLLQSYDFYHLQQTQGCALQIGGSDQWGNITAGVELIRKMQGESTDKEVAFGLTFPLVTKADGTKFGKTEAGTVWLDAERTSPYQFYQFLLRQSDDDIQTLVKFFSLKSWDEVSALLEKTKGAPQERAAQKSLAAELTALVHGEEESKRVAHASQVLFSGELQELDKKTILEVFAEAPSAKMSASELGEKTLVDVLVVSGLCTSKGNARKDIKAGAISINGSKLKGVEDLPGKEIPLLHADLLVLRKGKKNYCLVELSS